MSEEFEDHCWSDIIPQHIRQTYAPYKRNRFVGSPVAVIAIGLQELAYDGGDKSIEQLAMSHPHSCGAFAWAAIGPTQELFAAARQAKMPIFYLVSDQQRPSSRSRMPYDRELFAIKEGLLPEHGDVVITSHRPSVFRDTQLLAHLNRLGIGSVIFCGGATSGCVRASAVDAYSNGFHVVIAEECCFDRFELSHKINLFDLHHKYADVLHINKVLTEIRAQTSADSEQADVSSTRGNGRFAQETFSAVDLTSTKRPPIDVAMEGLIDRHWI